MSGVVEHIASGWSDVLGSTDELASFLRAPRAG